MNSETRTGETRAGFCQNCGKALDQETIRKVGTAVFCEPCLAARLGQVPAAWPVQPGYAPVNQGTGPRMFAGNPMMGGPPNPALAAFLGLIPGVGAMYNEQYAKGIVHLGVFAVLVSLANDVNSIFGLFVAGWIFYMAIEAHHTARARRDGLPLPNPFGLNEIGERLGFGRGWTAGPVGRPVPPTGPVSVPAPASGTPPEYPASGMGWSGPVESYGPAAGAPPLPPLPPFPPLTAADPWSQVGGAQTGAGAGHAAAGFQAPYGAGMPPYVPVVPTPLSQRQRVPAGAVWLIGLGTLFLLTNTEVFRGFRSEVLVGLGLIALSVWLFVRNMTLGGQTLVDDGSPLYRMRVVRAVRGSVWILLVGLLIVLNDFGLIRWHSSWPYFIILAGVMAIAERAATNAAAESAAYSAVVVDPQGNPPGNPMADPPVNPQTNPQTNSPADTAKGGS